jgi:hypothetical protein
MDDSIAASEVTKLTVPFAAVEEDVPALLGIWRS